MRTRTIMSILIALMVNAVLFGVGAIIVLTVPHLRARHVYGSGERGDIFR